MNPERNPPFSDLACAFFSIPLPSRIVRRQEFTDHFTHAGADLSKSCALQWEKYLTIRKPGTAPTARPGFSGKKTEGEP
ncbi:hypothetical protein [Streptomyces sp. NPDC001282]|uniref:hypothetical protein n=1 Tax=Streptomyces sp. NPDC001282 TaxID=3364557 RepID=UPI00368F344A